MSKLNELPFRESRKEYITRKYGDMGNVKRFDNSWVRSEKSDFPWVIAKRVILHNVGKSFDKAFSYYCKQVEQYDQMESFTFLEAQNSRSFI